MYLMGQSKKILASKKLIMITYGIFWMNGFQKSILFTFIFTKLSMEIQPTHLHNDVVHLVPLQPKDFEAVYAVASDPLIWEQHPNPDRYQRVVFENYFKGAIESKGAFLIKSTITNEVLGATRFYDYDAEKKEVKIGYTFFARSCWGNKINRQVKKLMLDYAFQFVDKVIFHVGSKNIRSQIAMERIGGIKVGEEEVAYYGESPKTNFVYEIKTPN